MYIARHLYPRLWGFFSVAQSAYIKSVNDAIANNEKLIRKLAHSVIAGPTGSGKTSFIDRLLQRPIKKFSKSTGVSEDVIVVDINEINPTALHAATAVGPDVWKETQYDVSVVKQITNSVPATNTLPPTSSKSSSPSAVKKPEDVQFKQDDTMIKGLEVVQLLIEGTGKLGSDLRSLRSSKKTSVSVIGISSKSVISVIRRWL